MLLPPVAAFLLAHALLVAVSAGTTRPAWVAGAWSGPDSGHYLSIARGGYTLGPCWPDDPPPGHCGNAGWMPLYPWLMRPLLAAHLAPPRAVAAGVAAVLSCASLVALWTLFLSSWPRHGLLALIVAAFLPGQVYLHGAFPLGLEAAAVIVALHAALSDRWGLAGAAGAVAALSHSVGWLIAPVLMAWSATAGAAGLEPAEGRRVRRGAGLAAALTGAGLLLFIALQRVTIGVWDAYLRVQGAYGHQAANPAVTWWTIVSAIVTDPWDAETVAPAVQAVTVAFLAIAGVVEAVRRRDRESSLIALYVAVLWIFPLGLGGTVSVYRTDAALLPGVILARRAPRTALLAALALLIPLAGAMGRLFFELRLV